MQPMLAVCASQTGILYINGQFSGEISANEPLIRPIAPRGAIYLDLRPMNNAYLPIVRKLVFSAGKPLPEIPDDVGIILWPGNITEIELAPPSVSDMQTRCFSFDGHSFSISGIDGKLCLGEKVLGALPQGAALPNGVKTPGGYAFTGDANGAMYLLSVDPKLNTATGFLSADKIEISDSGRIRAVLHEHDFAGHMRIESWQLTAEGLEFLSSKAAWDNGSPRHTETAQETALSVVQAMLLGRDAEEYMTENLRQSFDSESLRSRFELCTEMKYAHPDNRPCLALLHLLNERMAVAAPLYYRCIVENGKYLLDQIEIPE